MMTIANQVPARILPPHLQRALGNIEALTSEELEQVASDVFSRMSRAERDALAAVLGKNGTIRRSTEARLFWGFNVLIPADKWDAVHDDDNGCEIIQYGCEGNRKTAVCIAESADLVDIYSSALRVAAPLAPPTWHDVLRGFCDRHGLRWDDEGPSWHLAASRF
jgi:hypothetical protein